LISADNALDIQLSLITSVLRAVRVGIIVLDSEERVVLWNSWMEEHCRHTADEVLGKKFVEIFPTMENGRTHTAIQSALVNNFSSVISQTLNKRPFPIYAMPADAVDDVRIQQGVKVMPIEVGTMSRHCLIQITDVSMAVARERQLREQALELESKSYSDGLTGIANRRRFDTHVEDEFRRAKRTDTPLSLVMIDVDCFKAYNDNYGHPKGDQCLVQIAEALTRTLERPCDLLARYGGEEFMAVLPDTDAQGALNVAEAMLAEVETLAIEHRFSDIAKYVTISLGVITKTPTIDTAVAHIIGAADRALYRAKNQGRNRIVVDDDPVDLFS
jgi:diguanylate cyclase (GGDEF)-like protein